MTGGLSTGRSQRCRFAKSPTPAAALDERRREKRFVAGSGRNQGGPGRPQRFQTDNPAPEGFRHLGRKATRRPEGLGPAQSAARAAAPERAAAATGASGAITSAGGPEQPGEGPRCKGWPSVEWDRESRWAAPFAPKHRGIAGATRPPTAAAVFTEERLPPRSPSSFRWARPFGEPAQQRFKPRFR